mmetsp:Transcript_14427/g.23856  ORF Transcript_14427/g.23856 Transcript_14427/m.23856 type:complete len:304 (-) Transcript_14427:46-957(-)
MSFEPPTSVDDHNENAGGRFLPQAPPPAAAPPPPPTPPPQKNYDSFSTPFSPPNVVNYDDHVEASPASRRPKRTVRITEDNEQQGRRRESVQDPNGGNNNSNRSAASSVGDASLRPNIGESNAAIGEESLRESLWKGRVVNLVACTVALLLELPNLLGHVFSLHPARAVLGLYLSFFSLLLCGYEVDLYGRTFIRQNFGMLHHPIGRSFVLFLMGGLAIGQGGVLDYLVGAVFAWSSLYTAITFCWYPQYRQRTSLEDGTIEDRQSLYHQALQNNSWADPEQHLGEAASLLHKAVLSTTTPTK